MANIFDTITKKAQEFAPQFLKEEEGLAGTQSAVLARDKSDQLLRAISLAGEKIRKEAPLVKVAEAAPKATFNIFETISRAAGGLAQRFGILSVPKEQREPFLPKEGETLMDAVRRQPSFGFEPGEKEGVVEAAVSKGPAGKIPLVAPAIGLISEFLLPPYGPKGANIVDDLAKTASKPRVKGILLSGIKEITEDEAENLAVKLAKVDDPSLVQKELENFVNKKIPEAPKISDSKLPAKKIERGFVTSAKEVLPEAEKIAGQYVPRSTDELAIKARNLIQDDVITAEKLALEGTNDEAVATASELLKHYARKAEAETDIAIKNALYDQAAVVANTMARKLTDQGRAIQAASILGRLTPEGQVRFAAREIIKWNLDNPNAKIPELTGQQADKIITEMRAIRAMPTGEEQAIRFQKLQKEIQGLIPSAWWQKAVSIWKAGLLTGIKTSGLNIFANISHAGTEIIKDLPATGADYLLSLITGKRTKAFTVEGLAEGIKEGAEKGWRYLKTGYDERDIARKLDYKQVSFKNKYIQNYVDGVFRVIGAEDQPFYYGALRRSLHDQATTQAINKGLKGAERAKFIEDLVKNPTDEMSLFAVADAEAAVFQNRTALGDVARKIQKIPGAEFVVSFGRTPSAVAMQVINYTPVGPFIEIGKQIAKGKFDQRLLSQAIGRGAVGTGVLWVGSELFDKGIMTLDFPKTEKERELWKLEGRKANSIKIGDKWRTVQTLGPVGPALLIGGHLKSAFKEKGSATAAITDAIFGTMKSFTEQTFLKGVNDIMGAITDPERNAEYAVSSFISSFIPTIINDVARATDPKERRAENVIQRAQSRIPVLRQKLEPQVTALGERRERVGNALEVMLDPTRPSPDVSTSVVEELRRLWDSGQKVSPTLLGDKKGFKGLSQKENTELWELAGKMTNDKLTALFSREAYIKLSEEDKAKQVEKIVSQSKLYARAGMALKLTEGLKREELKDKLSSLKEGGLITKEVFDKYLQLR